MVAALILLNTCHALGAFFGISKDPVSCFTLVLTLFSPTNHVRAGGWHVRLFSALKAEHHTAGATDRADR